MRVREEYYWGEGKCYWAEGGMLLGGSITGRKLEEGEVLLGRWGIVIGQSLGR